MDSGPDFCPPNLPPKSKRPPKPVRPKPVREREPGVATVAAFITQLLSCRKAYTYAELLRSPTMRTFAKRPETRPWWDLLQLFAYGTYGDYIKNCDQLPPLNESMMLKLRQLTIISLAAVNKKLPYDRLLKELDVRDVRELEELITDAINNGAIVGKLYQRNQQLEVERCLERDVRAEEIPPIVTKPAKEETKVETDPRDAMKAMKATEGAGTSASFPEYELEDFMADVSSTAEPEKKKEESE